jgi:signal transduction histidine kinase
VAHEVNNPLNFARNSLSTLATYVDDVRGLLQRVSELDLADRAKLAAQLEALEHQKTELGFDELAAGLAELVAIVTEGLDRTSRLVSDLRDFAAPHRGGRTLVDVGVGLRSTLQLLGHRLRQAGARVELALAEPLPHVEGDAGALNQVFLNVLKNAAEAIEGQGGGTIHVHARAEGAALAVCIRDEGPGINSEALARLFEPFFTTKEPGRGTGLGLSMSRRIVEEHGGTIEVASEPGAGTAVTIRIPIGPAAGRDAA